MLDRKEGDLQGQIYHKIRTRILSGGLAAGVRLPSTRQLAGSLGISRATIVAAYERLQAEGYLLNEAGKASRVANIVLPLAAQKRFKTTSPAPITSSRAAITPATSSRATSTQISGAPHTSAFLTGAPSTKAHFTSAQATSIHPQLPLQLEPGVPDLTSFPSALWGRLLASAARHMPPYMLGYADTLGLPALKEAILVHIALRRGVVATPEQVVLFPSTRTAMALITRVALRHQNQSQSHSRNHSHNHNLAPVWVEDPAYPAAKRILKTEGGHLIPLNVDQFGINVEQTSNLPTPLLIYVTPSHQYPSGVTMSLKRRLRLLELAQQSGALILEDDYDSEFQFNGRPIAALQGIDHAGCVAYIGTLSKVLAPGVRLAYAVVPHHLLAAVQKASAEERVAVSVHTQAAFLAFLREGHFGAHIKRMTMHYAARMQAFREAILKLCPENLIPGPGTGGLQLALWFKNQNIDDKRIATALRQQLYAPCPLSSMYAADISAKNGLLCGIASLTVEQAPQAANAIARLLNSA